MKSEFLLRTIGEVDDAYVMEADEKRPVYAMRWTRYAAVAACLAVIGGGVLLLSQRGGLGSDSAGEKGNFFYISKDDKLYALDAECAPDAPSKTAPSASEAIRENITADAADTVPANTSLDTGVGTVVTDVTFCFRREGGFETVTKHYPDGLPSAAEILSDYLAAAGSPVRCVTATVEEIGATTVTSGGIVQHTPGVREMRVVLDGNPGEDILAGLSETVRRRGSVFYVQKIEILVGGETVLTE